MMVMWAFQAVSEYNGRINKKVENQHHLHKGIMEQNGFFLAYLLWIIHKNCHVWIYVDKMQTHLNYMLC